MVAFVTDNEVYMEQLYKKQPDWTLCVQLVTNCRLQWIKSKQQN